MSEHKLLRKLQGDLETPYLKHMRTWVEHQHIIRSANYSKQEVDEVNAKLKWLEYLKTNLLSRTELSHQEIEDRVFTEWCKEVGMISDTLIKDELTDTLTAEQDKRYIQLR